LATRGANFSTASNAITPESGVKSRRRGRGPLWQQVEREKVTWPNDKSQIPGGRERNDWVIRKGRESVLGKI